MGSSVELILASEFQGVPIWTFKLRYWRAIHGEVMTHRVFSRNASSSRAIPIEKMNAIVLSDTAGPESWGQNQKGMQAGQECKAEVAVPSYMHDPLRVFLSENDDHYALAMTDGTFTLSRETAWKFSAWLAVSMSTAFSTAGYHKQISNRITEPFQYINVVVTATDFDNFFALRCHPDAMPEFQNVANKIKHYCENGARQVLKEGEWHIPFLMEEDGELSLKEKLAISVSRSASVSYQTVDGQTMTAERAVALYDKLAGSNPIHASPLEHQAKAVLNPANDPSTWMYSNLSMPWAQYRKFVENNSIIS